MSGFYALLKISLRLNFGISALKYRYTREKKKLYEPILIGLAAVSGIGSVVAVYTWMMLGIFRVASQPPFNMPEMVITLGFLLGQFFVLFFGIFYTMGSFYFSNDMSMLVPLPLKPYEVLGCKFIVIMVNEYLTLVPFLLPPLVIYSAGTGQGVLFWLKAVILMLASPVIPLVLGAVIIMVLMRFVNFRRNKDLLAIIGGLLGLFLALGLNLFLSRTFNNEEFQWTNGMVADVTGLVEAVGSRFLPSLWATYGLSMPGIEGWLNLLLFVGSSAALFLLLLWIGNRMFYRSVLSGQEVSRKRKKLSQGEAERKFEKTASPTRAIFSKEWKLLLRTPVYVLNGLAGIIVGPFILVSMLFTGGNNEGMTSLRILLSNPENPLYVTLAGLALILFVSSMNVVASTSLSREGSTFWISKMIPVTPRQQVTAKLLHGTAVSELGIIVPCVFFPVFFGLPLLQTLYLFVAGLIGSFMLTPVGLILDILRPKLVWNNPTEAIKQNMNAVLGMLISIAILVGLGALTALFISLALSEWAIYLLIGVLMLSLSVVLTLVLFSVADRHYKKLEA